MFEPSQAAVSQVITALTSKWQPSVVIAQRAKITLPSAIRALRTATISGAAEEKTQMSDGHTRRRRSVYRKKEMVTRAK